MNNEIEPRIIAIISKVFNVDKNGISITDTKDDLERWDSIGHLQLIMSLESEFGIKFKTDEIVKLKDIKGIMNTVTLLLKTK